MAKFPEPPDPRAIAPIWRELPAGTRLWRIYRRAGRFPSTWEAFRWFGPIAAARFDHHQEPPRVQSRGVQYDALGGPTCLAEIFQQTRVIDRRAGEPWLVAFETAATVRLLNLDSPWPTQAGASMALMSGQRARARRWSQAIYAVYERAQGLWYPSSMDASAPCVVLYERAQVAVPVRPVLHLALADPRLDVPLQHAAVRFNYHLVG